MRLKSKSEAKTLQKKKQVGSPLISGETDKTLLGNFLTRKESRDSLRRETQSKTFTRKSSRKGKLTRKCRRKGKVTSEEFFRNRKKWRMGSPEREEDFWKRQTASLRKIEKLKEKIGRKQVKKKSERQVASQLEDLASKKKEFGFTSNHPQEKKGGKKGKIKKSKKSVGMVFQLEDSNDRSREYIKRVMQFK